MSNFNNPPSIGHNASFKPTPTPTTANYKTLNQIHTHNPQNKNKILPQIWSVISSLNGGRDHELQWWRSWARTAEIARKLASPLLTLSVATHLTKPRPPSPLPQVDSVPAKSKVRETERDREKKREDQKKKKKGKFFFIILNSKIEYRKLKVKTSNNCFLKAGFDLF